MSNYNILVIDDEVEIAELVGIFLSNEGYQVLKAFNGEEGLVLLEKENIQLVILDIMMPGIDGLEVCKRIRERWSIPIIMLSAKSQDMDKIIGLGFGADDYMTKPFNPLELVARVKSQLRRFMFLNHSAHEATDENLIRIKELTINKNNHVVTVYNKDVNLTPTEYKILLLLATHPGKVFSAEEIFEKVWEEKYYESNNTVMVHMWRLREKVEDNPKVPQLIETVWGVGYKIEN
ncbi:response regulator transcription factor [Vallitalea okinawensis]|uniref:response regulator transcription factor n=1 Tax=Vallitalea okinawensis TaxID=2078660 RepID=UPI000CFAD9DE|nr:response regulator transcription factor [Vallitalea okinawensis]